MKIMKTGFGEVLLKLRQSEGLNQRQLAAELKISQALLSHYENGSREPGLAFVCRVCDFFGVSADHVLGRSTSENKHIVGLQAVNELNRTLAQNDNHAVKSAAEDYLNFAAKRISAHLKSGNSELEAAQQAAEMSLSELKLINLLSGSEQN